MQAYKPIVVTLIGLMIICLSFSVSQAVGARQIENASDQYVPIGTGTSFSYNNIPFELDGFKLLYVKHTDDEFVPVETLDLSGYIANRIHIMEWAGWATNVPNGVLVGKINIFYKDGTSNGIDLIMGTNIAECAYDRPEQQCCLAHAKVPPAYSSWANFDSDYYYWAHNFYVSIDTKNKPLDHLELFLNPASYTGQPSCPDSCIQGTPSDWFGIGINAITLQVPPSYAISGKIFGDKIQGVVLTLGGESSAQTISDSNGDYSFNCLSNGDYIVTPSLEDTLTSITVGKITITADNIIPQEDCTFLPPEIRVIVDGADQTNINFTLSGANKWTASGNAVINSILHTSGDLSIDTSDHTVSGNCLLYAADIPVGSKTKTVNIYNGPFTFDAENASTSSININLLSSELNLAGLGVSIDKIILSDNAINIDGDLVWKLALTPGIKDKEALKLDFKELFINSSGIHLGGRITIKQDIELGIGKLPKEEAYLEYLPSEDRFGGGGVIELPGKWKIGVDLSLVSGKLDRVHASIGRDDYFKIPPPPETVIYLKQKLEGEVRKLSTPKPTIVLGKLEGECIYIDDECIPTSGFDAYILAPPVEILNHDYFFAYLTGGAYYDTTGELGIGGKVYVLRDDFELSTTKSIYNVTKGFYTTGELHFYRFQFKDNGQWYYVLLVNGQIKAGPGNFEGLFEGKMSVPDNIPVISTFFYPEHPYPEPIKIGTKAYIKNQTLACGVEYNIPYFNFKLKAVVKWDKDHGFRLGNYDEIQKIHFKARARYKPIDKIFTIVDGIKNVIVRFSWSTGTPAYVHLYDPTHKEIPQDNSESDKYLFGRNEDLKEICYALYEPIPGQWTFSLDDENIGDYSVEVLVPNSPPKIEFKSPVDPRENGSGTLTIQYNCTDTEDDVEVSLFWDEDATGFDGVPITTGLSKTNTSYVWDTSSMPTGTYYIYARADDGNNLPVYTYAPGSIRISNQYTVTAPSTITVTSSETSATLSWTASEGIIAYRVYWTDDLARVTYKNSLGIDNLNTYVIDNLSPGRFYRFAIAAIDKEYNESPPSDPIVMKTKLAKTNNPPLLVVPQEIMARVGREITGKLQASDVDGDEITYFVVSAPEGFVVDSAKGTYTWTPTEDNIGLNEITVKACDNNGAEDVRVFKIMVYSENQNSPPTIAMIPTAVITAGESYNMKIAAYDADGDDLSYILKAGPNGMIILDNNISWTTSKSDIGTHNVKVAVIDTANHETELAYQLTVLPTVFSVETNKNNHNKGGCFISAISRR